MPSINYILIIQLQILIILFHMVKLETFVHCKIPMMQCITLIPFEVLLKTGQNIFNFVLSILVLLPMMSTTYFQVNLVFFVRPFLVFKQ